MAQCVSCFCIVVIQPGDTLAAIAARFGTPGGFQQIACCNNIPNPNVIVPGQVILVPTPCPGPPTPPPPPPPPCPFSYTVQPGDTLFFIAQRFGVSLQALIAANPQIPNPNLIFPGQVITIPCPTPPPPPPPPPCPFSYTVVSGDTLFFIAQRFGVSLQALIAANPQIPDPNLIFPGQVITIPCPTLPPPPPPPPCPFSYTVVSGDTLFFIAQRFGVSLQKLIAANPQIPDPNLIFPGQVITVPCPGDP